MKGPNIYRIPKNSLNHFNHIMKQFILPLVALLGMSVPFSAQADTLSLGYVNADAELGGDNGANMKNVWSSGAIHIPASTAKTLAGSKITHINAAIQSTLHVDKMKVWVRTSLDGENIVEREINKTDAPKLTKSWNNVELETPFEIPADLEDGFYIGFSVYHTGVAYIFANTDAPAQGGWFTDIDEGGWLDHSADGALCLRATVEGDNLPATNLSIVDFVAPETLIKDRKQVKGSATVKNNGTKDVESFNMSLIMNGDKVGVAQRTLNIPSGGVATFDFVIEPDITAEGDYKVDYVLDNINTGDDADMSDNTVADQFLQVINEGVRRVVGIEEFTTERCPNCPSATYTLQSYSEKEQYKDRIAIVCHHAGYYTDWLTTDYDEALTWFYGGGSTYAPGIMVDRYTLSNSPVMYVNEQNLDSYLPARLNKEPQLALKVEVTSSESTPDVLKVKVDGTKYTDNLCNMPAITVYLIEDNIKAIAQSGGGTNFVHQHVGRACNTTWGEPIEFNENNAFQYNCQFNIKSGWKRDDLGVVVAVHNLNESYAGDWEVMNAAIVHASEFKTDGDGIKQVADIEEEANAEYYTLSGVKVSSENLAPGVYIRKAGEKATKVVIR